ncbi:MAG: ABC transporter permease [Spirochaetaceae bacterium]|nr:ABC transporter permease [Spirochaetaceae bacterium]
MFDDFLFALRNFRRNKIRSFLSLLGIIIGVASVIVITSLSESATKSIKDSYGSAGLDIVKISSGYMQRRKTSTLTFNETFREDLFNSIPGIKQIQYTNNLSATLGLGDTSVTTNATAIEYGYLDMVGLKLQEGTDFNISDNVTGQQKIIIGKEIADALFPEGNAVGNVINLVTDNTTFSFQINGVLASSTGMESTDNAAYIPRGFYAKKIMPSPNAGTIVVQCTSENIASKVADSIKTFIEEISGSPYSARVTSMQAMLEQYEEVSGTVSMMLSGIAAISLLVGGIGIMNIMIVTVTERRREIGIRKALGATPSVIKVQFLVESAMITVVGGIIGIFAGIGISAIIAVAMKQPFAIQWSACFIAFVFSAAIGIFFGLSPASRAAKLDPVEALSSE